MKSKVYFFVFDGLADWEHGIIRPSAFVAVLKGT